MGAFAVASLLSVSLVGCLFSAPVSPSPSATGGASAAPSQAPPSADPERARTLVLVLETEPARFSPAATDPATVRLNDLLYDGLYRLDQRLVPQPDLAAAPPTYDPAGTVWLVPIRTDVRFHDGTPLTAADVVFTYQLALSPNCPFGDVCGVIGESLSAVEMVDEQTAKFTLRRPFAPFLGLGLARLDILPQAAVRTSLGRYLGTAGKLDVDVVNALTERIAAATNAEECIVESPPAECDPAFYIADLEKLLRRGAIQLPEPERFPALTGGLDRAAYAAELLVMVEDIAASLRSRDLDQAAAAFPLLDFQRNPIGTGDYAFEQYEPGQSVELRRVTPDAGQGGVPARARGLIITDPAAAATTLRTGDADWLAVVSPDEVPSLETDPAVRVAGRPGGGYRAIVFNIRAGRPYADPVARRAFAMCIDRPTTVDGATSGRSVPATTPLLPGTWAYADQGAREAFDPSAAATALEAAGWARDGQGIYSRQGLRLSSAIWVRPSRADQRAFAESAAEQLERCGIELRVEELGFSGDELLRQVEWPNDFDTFLASGDVGLDPHVTFAGLHSSRITTEENPGDANFGGWSDTRVDGLIDDGSRQLDLEARRGTYARLQELIATDVPLYPWWYDTLYSGLSTTVRGPAGPPDPSEPYFDHDPEGWRLAQPGSGDSLPAPSATAQVTSPGGSPVAPGTAPSPSALSARPTPSVRRRRSRILDSGISRRPIIGA